MPITRSIDNIDGRTSLLFRYSTARRRLAETSRRRRRSPGRARLRAVGGTHANGDADGRRVADNISRSELSCFATVGVRRHRRGM